MQKHPLECFSLNNLFFLTQIGLTLKESGIYPLHDAKIHETTWWIYLNKRLGTLVVSLFLLTM